MSTTQMLDAPALLARVKMAVEGLKKKPVLMKAGPGYLQLASDYVEAVVNAKKDGKLLVFHGTQMPTGMFYAMDMVPNLSPQDLACVGMARPLTTSSRLGKSGASAAEEERTLMSDRIVVPTFDFRELQGGQG